MTGGARDAEIDRLWRHRPRDRFLRTTAALLTALVVASLASGAFRVGDLFNERRLRNLERFAGELVPHPLRGDPDATLGDAVGFYAGLLADGGALALGITLAISITAAVLAGALGAAAAPLVARNLATAEPFTPGPRPASRVAIAAWNAWRGAARAVLVFLRAIPEYLWAFLLISMFGLGAWPAILALALHNAGILGRLGGEVLENVEPTAPRTLRSLGASRLQIVCAALVPAAMPRFVAYFFYRWETCVREATVLGMLGILSLGYVVTEARSGLRYDEMVFYIALGAVVVQVGDAASSWARRVLREAGGKPT